MNKVSVFEQADASGAPYRLVVSVAHGAVLPEKLTGFVMLDFGRTLPTPTTANIVGDGLTAKLLFGDVGEFHCHLPWKALHVIATQHWSVSWVLDEPEAPEAPKPGLRLV